MTIKRYIIGKHINDQPGFLYWRLPDDMQYVYKPGCEIADLAIVENMDSIALVRIVGCASMLGDFPYGHKKVLQLIVRDGWNLNQYQNNPLPF